MKKSRRIVTTLLTLLILSTQGLSLDAQAQGSTDELSERITAGATNAVSTLSGSGTGSEIELDDIVGRCGEDALWVLSEDDGVLSITGKGATYDWSEISDLPWLPYRDIIKSVIVEPGITHLGNNAFYGCSGITDITIGSDVQSIGDNAFTYCTGVSSISFDPEGSLKTIGSSAFYGGNNVTAIVIPDSVVTIGASAFEHWRTATELTIGSGTTAIGDRAFAYCSGLTEITVPGNVESIGNYAFDYCSGASSVVIENGVETIGEGAFHFCSGIDTIVLPDSVTSLGKDAFYNCSLERAELSAGMTTIPERAFYNVLTLKEVVIPDSITLIDTSAFGSCNGLTDVYYTNLESKWNEIQINGGNDPLLAATKHFSYFKDSVSGKCGDNAYWTLLEDGTMTISGTGDTYEWNSVGDVPWIVYREKISKVVIEPGITSIGSHAFQYSTILSDITIGKDVRSIGEQAFSYNAAVESLTFEEGCSLETIGDSAFYGLRNMNSIVIPDTVVSIGASAFELWQNAADLTIGSGVSSIGDRAFAYCSSLSEITVPGTVDSIGDYAFDYCTGAESIVIEDGVETIGEGAFHYCSGIDSIIIPNSVTSLGKNAFYNCSLERVELSSGMTTIPERAFYNVLTLKEVVIPDSITLVDTNAFAVCNSLTDVYYTNTESKWNEIQINSGNDALLNATKHFCYFKDSVSGKCGDNAYWTLLEDGTMTISGTGDTYDWDNIGDIPWIIYREKISKVVIEPGITSIGKNIFYSVPNLTDVTIGKDVVSIGDNAFYYSTAISSITFAPDCSLENIGNYAFYGGNQLTSIVIPDSVVTIGASAFEHWRNATVLSIGSGTTTIGDRAFAYCGGLTEITVPGTVENIGNYAFDYCTSASSVVIEDGVETIGEGAFHFCSGIDTIVLPDSVTSLGKNAFYNCSLERAELSAGMTTIPERAFYNVQTLKEVVIPNSITLVDTCAFSSCLGLTDVYFLGYSTEWDAIDIKEGNDPLLNARIHNYDFDVTPKIKGAASKLYEPWGLKFYAVFEGENIDKIKDLGMAFIKDAYYSEDMTPQELLENENAYIFTLTNDGIAYESPTTNYPNGRYSALLDEGIYSYDIDAQYYVLPFAISHFDQYAFGSVRNTSMQAVLNSNLNSSAVSQNEKDVCNCILALKESVADYYDAQGGLTVSKAPTAPRGNTQTAASVVKTMSETGITPKVASAASRVIEPWGLKFLSTYTDDSRIVDRGMVLINEDYYSNSYPINPDEMRTNTFAYIFSESNNMLQYDSGTGRFSALLTDGLSSKDIDKLIYAAPYVVLDDGSYVYGTIKSSSMLRILNINLTSSSVSQLEKDVCQDIIDLYNAVTKFYEQ